MLAFIRFLFAGLLLVISHAFAAMVHASIEITI